MSKCDVVVGIQWGDEGKGKIVDNLARDYDIVVRYQGGAYRGGRWQEDRTPSRA